MSKQYPITLTDAERSALRELIRKGTLAARKLTRAHILLHAAAARTESEIADALHVGVRTVERVRQRFVEGHLVNALRERSRPGGKPKLDAKAEALLIATACSTAPEGRARWTLHLLADELVALAAVDAVSYETVRRTLKKTCLRLGSLRNGSFLR